MGDGASAVKFGGLAPAARSTLGKVLNAMPVAAFVEACVSMLASDSMIVCCASKHLCSCDESASSIPPQIHVGALELLSERIPKIVDHVRRDIAAKVNKVVELSIKLLAQDNIHLRAHVLRVLAAVGSTLVPGEEGTLTTSLPPILGALSIPDLVNYALDALIPLPYVSCYP